MDAGELREPLAVLELQTQSEKYEWVEGQKLWGKADPKTRMNLFSRVGIGAKTVVFTTRKCTLNQHNALRWQGKHYFITDIAELERGYYEIATAAIEPLNCTLERTRTGKDELKRPVILEPESLLFPACLTEKYLGFEQGKPMAITEVTYVLVTPKPVELRAGDVVQVNLRHFAEPLPFVVQMCHVLDEYKNEYEINRKADV